MLEKVRYVGIRIKERKKDIAVIVGWVIVIMLIIVKTHEFFYLENSEFSTYKIPYLHYKGPTFTELDKLLLVISSFVVGMILTDVKSVVYGYFASVILSFFAGTIYVFLYIWFVLGLGAAFSLIPFGWEWVLLLAFMNVFRSLFPMGILLCLIGESIGSFVRVWLRP